MSLFVSLRSQIFDKVRNIVFPIRLYSDRAIQLTSVTCNNEVIRSSSRSEFDIDWEEEIKAIKTPSALDPCVEDVSDVKPFLRPTYNVAAYINKSDTLKRLLNLGVDLYAIEKKHEKFKYVMRLDFDRHVKNHLIFLNDLIPSNLLGAFITKNPFIFKDSLEDLQIRLNYLSYKKFDQEMITRIITKNPFWLSFETKRIDRKLGHFQKQFNLNGDEVRLLATRSPKLITFKMSLINLFTFVIKEELGFEEPLMKEMLLTKPCLWMADQNDVIKIFTYIHHTMKIPHEVIVTVPGILLCREFRLRQRNEFLKKLGRDQYDPKKENYVPLYKLIEKTDIAFCNDIAKCSVQDFNLYLKTL